MKKGLAQKFFGSEKSLLLGALPARAAPKQDAAHLMIMSTIFLTLPKTLMDLFLVLRCIMQLQVVRLRLLWIAFSILTCWEADGLFI
jgi:hypothetical protein